MCKANPECKWFNFDPKDNNLCVLTSDCPETTYDCIGFGCVYGQVGCELDVWAELNIMVATGVDNDFLDSSEVIDTENVTSCNSLPEVYPFQCSRAVAMKHNSKMVICGGETNQSPRDTSDCYGYSNDRWNLEAFKLEPSRYDAMSVEIRPGEWLVMGGYNDGGYGYLIDTRLLKNGIFINGPDLPEEISSGSAVMLNETHLFVAGCYYGPNYSLRNYLLDINTEQWTQIADRTLEEPPNQYIAGHSSGTFYNYTAGEIQVANIGGLGIEVYSQRFDSWHQISFPSPLTFLNESVAIQQGPDSFILIGGQTNLEEESGDVYLFDDNGLSVLKEDVLQIPRRLHVALSISDNDFNCY